MSERLTPNGFKKPLAKLAFLNLPVGDVSKGTNFYQALTGTDFAKSLWEEEHFHAPISRGVQLHISKPYFDGQTALAHFAVADLADTISELTASGGKVVHGEFVVETSEKAREILSRSWPQYYGCEPATSMGRAVLMMDPWGNVVGLIQLEEWAERAFRYGHISDIEFAVQEVAMQNGKQFR